MRITQVERIRMIRGTSTAPVERTIPDRAKVTLNRAIDHSTRWLTCRAIGMAAEPPGRKSNRGASPSR